MIPILNENNKKQIKANNFVIIFLHVILLILLLIFIPKLLLVLLGVVLPTVFEFLYTLWVKLFQLVLPLGLILSSSLVVLLPNPIYGLFALITVFLTTALFLLSIQVQFLAFIYLIIYIGAIAILFLFVIMLFNMRSLTKSDSKIKDFSFLSISFKIYYFFGIKFFMFVVLDIYSRVQYNSYINSSILLAKVDIQHFLTYVNSDALLFGNLFYDYYAYLFLLAGLILLTSMLGSIILALSTRE